MDEDQSQEQNPAKPNIHFIGMDDLSIFLVPDSELREIERGSPGNLKGNIAITLLSVFGGGVISALLGTIPTNIYMFTTLVVIMTLSLIVGVILYLLSRQERKDTEDVIKRIRARAKLKSGPQVTGKMLPQVKMIIDATDEENQ